MRVALINPPFGLELSVGTTRGMRYVLNVTPPLGLAYLAAVMRHDGHEVILVDCTVGIARQQLKNILEGFRPEVVGLTGTTPSFMSMVDTARKVRAWCPTAKIVAGGAQATVAPQATLTEFSFDAVPIGDGEVTRSDLVRPWSLDPNADLASVAGIAFLRDGEYHRTAPRALIRDLDSIPFPAYDLLPPLRRYHPTPASYRKLPLATMMTSRGCPNRCVFCDRSIFGNRCRRRSVENALDEVELLLKRVGAREIRFFDDTFTLNRDWVFRFCDGLRSRGLKFPWTCLTSVLSVRPDLLKTMKKSGCYQVLYGLESGDDDVLKRLGKGNTVEDNIRAIRWAQEAGLEIRGDFLFGTPWETPETLEKTLKFAIDMKIDYATFNHLIPFPGTELYDYLVENEGFQFDFHRHCSIIDHSAAVYVPSSIPRQQYKELLDYANKRFYLRPMHILRRLLALRTPTQVWGQVMGLYAMLSL